jgi:hypothetical protein
VIEPKRSPQNWSSTSIVTVAPCVDGLLHDRVDVPTYMKMLTLVPPSSVGGFVLDCGTDPTA